MKQSPPRSKYQFIPRPIEQKLVASQVGDVLDYYQFGWRRNNKGDRSISWRLAGLVLTLIGLVSTYYSMQISNEIIQMSGLIGPAGLLIVALPVIILVIGCTALFHPIPFCLVACVDGLIYAKKKRVTVIPWAEIAWCEQKTVHNSLGNTFHKFTIHTHNGKNIRWKVAEHLMENLERIIYEHIC